MEWCEANEERKRLTIEAKEENEEAAELKLMAGICWWQFVALEQG